ncbi:hypothetical protein DFH08DRAFT_937629, partial [Mycena albidolilacea]
MYVVSNVCLGTKSCYTRSLQVSLQVDWHRFLGKRSDEVKCPKIAGFDTGKRMKGLRNDLVPSRELAVVAGTIAKSVLNGVDSEMSQVGVESADEFEGVLEAEDLSANRIVSIRQDAAFQKVGTVPFESPEDSLMLSRLEFGGMNVKRLVFGVGDVGVSFAARERVGGSLRTTRAINYLHVKVRYVVAKASKTAAKIALRVEVFERFVITPSNVVEISLDSNGTVRSFERLGVTQSTRLKNRTVRKEPELNASQNTLFLGERHFGFGFGMWFIPGDFAGFGFRSWWKTGFGRQAGLLVKCVGYNGAADDLIFVPTEPSLDPISRRPASTARWPPREADGASARTGDTLIGNSAPVEVGICELGYRYWTGAKMRERLKIDFRRKPIKSAGAMHSAGSVCPAHLKYSRPGRKCGLISCAGRGNTFTLLPLSASSLHWKKEQSRSDKSNLPACGGCMFESRVDARPTRATRIGGGPLSENRAEREDLGRDSAARGKAKGGRVGNKRIWRRDETMAGWYARMDRETGARKPDPHGTVIWKGIDRRNRD